MTRLAPASSWSAKSGATQLLHLPPTASSIPRPRRLKAEPRSSPEPKVSATTRASPAAAPAPSLARKEVSESDLPAFALPVILDADAYLDLRSLDHRARAPRPDHRVSLARPKFRRPAIHLPSRFSDLPRPALPTASLCVSVGA